MNEFKITYKTTLYELQEFCKQFDYCEDCPLARTDSGDCVYHDPDLFPAKWLIRRPKTYLEDFHEKMPKAEQEYELPVVCVDEVYGTEHKCNASIEECVECWNNVMESEE